MWSANSPLAVNYKLIAMNTDLIDRKKEPGSTEENVWPHPAPPPEPDKDAEIAPQVHLLLLESLEFTRSHDFSPLND
jgi:hypothetical protein